MSAPLLRTPNGIRTRAAAVKGRCPRPLDDGGSVSVSGPNDVSSSRGAIRYSRQEHPPVARPSAGASGERLDDRVEQVAQVAVYGVGVRLRVVRIEQVQIVVLADIEVGSEDQP